MAAHLESDVLWLSERDRARGGNVLGVAPLQVWGPLRDKLLADDSALTKLQNAKDLKSLADVPGLKVVSEPKVTIDFSR